MNSQQYIKQIRTLLALSKNEEAIRILAELSVEYPKDNFNNFAIQISSQFKRLKEANNLGTLSREDYSLEQNRITQAILEKLNELEKEPQAVNQSANVKKGRIIHNVPNKMSRGMEYVCTIRLAATDELLLRGFPLREESRLEEIDQLTDIMAVELIDESGGKMFEIRQINREQDQHIVGHSFTQWKFGVKPLLEGKGCLILTVLAVYEMPNGEKVRREIPYERIIEIEAYNENYYVENPTTRWEDTGMTLEELRSKRWLPLIGGWSSLSAASKAMLLVLAMSGIGFGVFSWLQPPKLQPVLKIHNQLLVSSVEIDGEIISDWTANSDSTELTLPIKLTTGKAYKFVVTGKNGSCEKQDTLHKNNAVISMDCIITPEKVSPVLSIDNALKVQTVKVYGVIINDWKANPDTTEITLPPMGVDSAYLFEVNGSNGKCTKRIILTKENPVIELPCKIAPTEYTLTIYTPFQNPILKAGNEVQNPLGESDYNRKSYTTRYRLQQGTYDLQVSNPNAKQVYICKADSINLNMDTSIRMDCSLPPPSTYSVTIKIRNQYRVRINIEDVWIELDGVRQNVVVTRQIESERINVELTATLSNVTRGRHRFQIKSWCRGRTISCDVQQNLITGNTSIEFTCPLGCAQIP